MTRLWLVRHGPTHAKAMVGWTDLAADLSDTATIARLRDYLPDAPVVSSDLSRAVATADVLSRKLRLPHDPGLREIHFGQWEMRTFADVEAETPDLIRKYWETPGSIAPPGGESWNAMASRTDAAVDSLLARGHPDLIVVCHFGVILRQLQRALGVSTTEVFGYSIDNLSVTRIEAGAGGWTARAINHVP
ncbi:histidine phosphatase family protein [Flavimaricola marinus]|uniref:Alpha-ribazole phosphatase n=1 Tax=Flavimaricola marinus TaxID=1819565 RepID=A0A238L8V5_9RHOB|nr:histidine phosphatase family protein [Flavimaricola marinus]SMY06022.1 Alpha-ribazole phosphatase [Flavimaricola marinus]